MNRFLDAFVDKLYLQSIDHFVNYKKHLKDYAIVIIVALFLRSMVFVIYTIPTGSMIPNLMIGDVLLADKFYYGLKFPFTDEVPGMRLKPIQKPDIGDIVVFRAPREDLFYRITFSIKDEKKAESLLLKLNAASSFKRPISWEGKKINYIFENSSRNIILIHYTVFEKYQKEITSKESGLSVANIDKLTKHMTYLEVPKTNLLSSILDTPIAGASIVASVFLDTPLGSLYKAVLVCFIGDKNEDFMDKFMSFSLYPNRYVDTTKDYVKRLIAKEGDKVEMKDGILYINGEAMDKIPLDDNLSDIFRYYKESLIRDGKKIEYTTRYLNEYIVPLEEDARPFRSDLWPYDPTTSPYQNGFSRNFGPVVVPKGHYLFMGDNRDDSLDGRYFGTTPEWAVKGRPFFRVLPVSRFGKIK